MDADPEFCALGPADRRLARELVLGVLRWRTPLDWLVARRQGARTQDPRVLETLRLGLYQLLWLDRIPDHAAVNDAVELCRRAGRTHQSGFVNAFLRGTVRERDAIRAALASLRQSDPATGWSHPAWLVQRWARIWSPEKLQQLLAWNNTPPGVSVRANTLRTSPEALTARWAAEGVAFRSRPVDWAPAARMFDLETHPPLPALASFQDGGFYVQDPSTLLAVTLLDPQPGEVLLDACAAPGGKTTFIAQLQAGSGRLVGEDLSASRLELLRENCARLGAGFVEIRQSAPDSDAAFDGILADVPCSNTGVLRRRVESRWRLQSDALQALASRQLELLRPLAARLKPGGRLVYSTCSLEAAENREVVDRFMAEAPEFFLEVERQLHPVTDGVDGAYAARLRRAPTARD